MKVFFTGCVVGLEVPTMKEMALRCLRWLLAMLVWVKLSMRRGALRSSWLQAWDGAAFACGRMIAGVVGDKKEVCRV